MSADPFNCPHTEVTLDDFGSAVCHQCRGTVVYANALRRWVSMTEPSSTRPAMTSEVAKMAEAANPIIDSPIPKSCGQMIDLTPIPQEVIDAEKRIVTFMESKGGGPFEIGRLCSRDHAEKLRTITRTLLQLPDQ